MPALNGATAQYSSRSRMSLVTSMRDIVAIGFRHLGLIISAFMGTATVAALVFLWLNPYQSELDILLHHNRVDPVLTTQAATLGGFSQDAVAEEEQNSEVKMLSSPDLLTSVAEESGLSKTIFMWPWANPALRVPKAAKKLSTALAITPLTKSNVIQITYNSSDPQMAFRVLDTLSTLYIQKHLRVHRPNGAGRFFEDQADQYWKKLSNAESNLIAFGEKHNVAAPVTDRDAALQKVNELEYDLGQTEAAISGSKERIRSLETQLTKTPARLSTSLHVSDNGALLAQLKGSLSTLELRRTELLSTYTSDYLPVRELEEQINQTKVTIAAAEKTPLHEDTTDVNPTYQLLSNDLAKTKSDLAAFSAQATATEDVIRGYRSRTLSLDLQAVEQDDLVREVKTAEQSYLLYRTKSDEERIQNVLDEKGILNISIQSPPMVPKLPYYSPVLLVMLATLLGIFVSVSVALVAEYLDLSFRTPDEVRIFLDIPVLAGVPANR